jgi:hypothetical protein
MVSLARVLRGRPPHAHPARRAEPPARAADRRHGRRAGRWTGGAPRGSG